ncbi:MAG: hypothetical protein DME36_00665 [Verrucomicrobia bacterium]|nr:MAG: hypothetical protein DME36_00665 [Verrucomicrobiota bacterium]
MEWIRAHYERVALLAAAIFLFFCAILIWRNAVKFGADFAGRKTEPQLKNASPPPKAVELGHAAEELEQPAQWTSHERSGLFVPEKHFIDANGLPATLKTTMVHPPVPNEWLEQFNLPIADADVLEQDPDRDGFTNFDEWQGHTNPIDKNSHPDYLTKLKVKSTTEEPFQVMFSSSVGDTYAINTIDMSQPTQFLKIGATIAGTRFKIVKFTPKDETNQYGTRVDASELTLEQEDTKEQLTLVKEKVAMSPESVVTFVYSWPATAVPREFEVRKDQEFSLKPVDEIKYKLVDVQPDKAVIVNTKVPNEPIEIGMLSP